MVCSAYGAAGASGAAVIVKFSCFVIFVAMLGYGFVAVLAGVIEAHGHDLVVVVVSGDVR